MTRIKSRRFDEAARTRRNAEKSLAAHARRLDLERAEELEQEIEVVDSRRRVAEYEIRHNVPIVRQD